MQCRMQLRYKICRLLSGRASSGRPLRGSVEAGSGKGLGYLIT